MLCSVVLPKGKKTKPNPKQPKAETSERASPNNTQNKQKLSRNLTQTNTHITGEDLVKGK